MTERYVFEVGEGIDYDLLENCFNPTTQSFIKLAGIKPGMRVLDVGSGSGGMTVWLAQQVGPSGQVIALDNHPNQLEMVRKRAAKHQLDNIECLVLSVYDLAQISGNFDLIYCRFLLHHLHQPQKAIALFHDKLKSGGLYVGEEGVINQKFSYPHANAWPNGQIVQEVQTGDQRDGDVGLRLFELCRDLDLEAQNLQLVQPLLWQAKQKKGLLDEKRFAKQSELAEGLSEQEWQSQYDALVAVVDDPSQLIGFYASIQIVAQKK